jgi:hypothetical protein
MTKSETLTVEEKIDAVEQYVLRDLDMAAYSCEEFYRNVLDVCAAARRAVAQDEESKARSEEGRRQWLEMCPDDDLVKPHPYSPEIIAWADSEGSNDAFLAAERQPKVPAGTYLPKPPPPSKDD